MRHGGGECAHDRYVLHLFGIWIGVCSPRRTLGTGVTCGMGPLSHSTRGFSFHSSFCFFGDAYRFPPTYSGERIDSELPSPGRDQVCITHICSPAVSFPGAGLGRRTSAPYIRILSCTHSIRLRKSWCLIHDSSEADCSDLHRGHHSSGKPQRRGDVVAILGGPS